MPRIEEKLIQHLHQCEQLFQEGRSGEAKDLLDLISTRIQLEMLASLRRCESSLERVAAVVGEAHRPPQEDA